MSKKNQQEKRNDPQLHLRPTLEVPCAFCGGRGRDPFGVMSPPATCQVCRGRGFHSLPLPIIACAYCRGTGVHPFSRLTCTTCRGVGVNTIPAGAITCPGCGGSRREADFEYPDSLLACRYCLGKGIVAANRMNRTFQRPTAGME